VPDAATAERIHATFEAFFRGDLDGAVAAMTPDVVGYDAPEMPDSGVIHGRDAVKARLAGFLELFGDLELAELRIEDVSDRILVVIHVRGRARAGEAPVAFDLAYLLRMRDDGLADEIRSYFTEDAARAYLNTNAG
jgi:ketosteroid isomerase-like protein